MEKKLFVAIQLKQNRLIPITLEQLLKIHYKNSAKILDVLLIFMM